MPAVVRSAAGVQGGRSASSRGNAPASSRGRKPPPDAAGMRFGAGLSPGLALKLAAGVVALCLIVALVTGGRGRALVATLGDGIVAASGRAGVRLRSLQLQGVSPVAQRDVVHALDLAPGRPLLGLDLAALRERLEQVGWIKTARVSRRLPDTLVVSVVERPRLAVWQTAGRNRLIDAQGQVIPEADAAGFTDLPLVVGEGANEAAAAMLPLVQARPRLASRVEALVRVDARRWDLRLKDGAIIQLPAAGEDAALIELDQLDQRSRLLELGFARIDLRNPDFVSVRPRAATPSSDTPRP